VACGRRLPVDRPLAPPPTRRHTRLPNVSARSKRRSSYGSAPGVLSLGRLRDRYIAQALRSTKNTASRRRPIRRHSQITLRPSGSSALFSASAARPAREGRRSWGRLYAWVLADARQRAGRC
jgi:hypothetical protein